MHLPYVYTVFLTLQGRYSLRWPAEHAREAHTYFRQGAHDSRALQEHVLRHFADSLALTQTREPRYFTYHLTDKGLEVEVLRLAPAKGFLSIHQGHELSLLHLLSQASTLYLLQESLNTSTAHAYVQHQIGSVDSDHYEKGAWLINHYLYQTDTITKDQLALWEREHPEYKGKTVPLRTRSRQVHEN